jgi:hypothetical protein
MEEKKEPERTQMDVTKMACVRIGERLGSMFHHMYPIAQTVLYVAFSAVSYRTSGGIKSYPYLDTVSYYIALFDFFTAFAFVTWSICKRAFGLFLTGSFLLVIGIAYSTALRWPPSEYTKPDPYYTHLFHVTTYHYFGSLASYILANIIAKEELRRLNSFTEADSKSV